MTSPQGQAGKPVRVPRVVWLAVLAAAVGGGWFALFPAGRPAEGRAAETDVVDAKRAYEYLVEVCGIGPRPSGSPGMERQQKLIIDHFEKLGAEVRLQEFDATHPLTGEPVRMANILVTWHPQSTERVLLACHYDTRPFPDRDPKDPKGVFVGANDGASGVALFMELAHHLPRIRPTYGVDMVFFDGEELIFENNRGTYFLGSEYFSSEYRKNPPPHRYVYGVVVDMVADKKLELFKERNSVAYARDLVESIWATAKRLKVGEFDRRIEYDVQDDHLPLNETAGIPSCDIIDFNYPHWHTTQDVPANCSGASLAKVGRVLLEWLTKVPPPGS